MKKIRLFLLFLILFIPFIVGAKICDTDKISVDSITMEEKNGDVVEVEQAEVIDKKIVLNISMFDVGDSIKYKVIVKNDSKDDYELSKESFNLNSDYIDYTVLFDDNSNIIKGNSTKAIYLEAEYKNKVPDNAFESGLFNENQKLSVNLYSDDVVNDSNVIPKQENSNKTTEPDIITEPTKKDLNSNLIVEKNPETSVQSYIIFIFLGLTISTVIYVVLRKKKRSIIMMLIIGTAIIIPVSVYALCKCDIEFEINVKIEKKYQLAKQLLVINPDGENKEEKSPYVLYPSKKGDLLCRVLYDKDSQYGLQVVTDNPVTLVTLGKDDPSPNVSGTGTTRAGNSYNRAVMTLNEKALEYMDTYEIAKDARSIGSLPDNKNYPDNLTGTERTSLYWEDKSDFVNYSQIYSLINRYFKADENKNSDVEALKLIDAFTFEDSSYASYWLASRSTFEMWGTTFPGSRSYVNNLLFYIEKVSNLNNSTASDNIIHFWYKNQSINYSSATNGFRPVFIINDNVIITQGNGTKESPYVLSVKA